MSSVRSRDNPIPFTISPKPAGFDTSTPGDEYYTAAPSLSKLPDRTPIVQKLHQLHADEFEYFSRSIKARRAARREFFRNLGEDLRQFASFVANSIINIFRSIFHGKILMTRGDFLSVLIFTFGAIVVMTIMLIWCIASNIPVLRDIFWFWSSYRGSGHGLVNAMNPNLFRELTEEQTSAAKAALSRPMHASQQTEVVEESHIDNASSLHTAEETRTFDLDIAKLLLQLASLMYERGSESIHEGINSLPPRSAESSALGIDFRPDPSPVSQPGKLLRDTFGLSRAREIDRVLHSNAREGTIQAFSNHLGIEYSPVSELNCVGSAYAALFWDPLSTWIVLAFKGTSPTEFDEWVTDFSFSLSDSKQWLGDGFGKVHGGFKERIFPDATDMRKPYETITTAVKLLSGDLLAGRPENTKVNLYFTGHSLGCAIASLAYTRALGHPEDFGSRVVLRDGYLFAAPIVCDAASVKAFNKLMNNPAEPRTLWRVTNANDAVATGLPDLGDRQDLELSPNNLFAFAHLGAEIRMRSKPLPSMITGNLIRRDISVSILSSFPANVVGTLEKTPGLSPWLLALQNVWGIGRLVAHATTHYWDQLQRVGVGECVWMKQ